MTLSPLFISRFLRVLTIRFESWSSSRYVISVSTTPFRKKLMAFFPAIVEKAFKKQSLSVSSFMIQFHFHSVEIYCNAVN